MWDCEQFFKILFGRLQAETFEDQYSTKGRITVPTLLMWSDVLIAGGCLVCGSASVRVPGATGNAGMQEDVGSDGICALAEEIQREEVRFLIYSGF